MGIRLTHLITGSCIPSEYNFTEIKLYQIVFNTEQVPVIKTATSENIISAVKCLLLQEKQRLGDKIH